MDEKDRAAGRHSGRSRPLGERLRPRAPVVVPFGHTAGYFALCSTSLKRQTRGKVAITVGALLRSAFCISDKDRHIERGLETVMGGKKVEHASMQGCKNCGEREEEGGKASFEVPWSLGSGHPKLYLVQFGS